MRKLFFFEFQNETNHTVIDRPPNNKPDVLQVAVCKAVILASLRCSYLQVMCGTKRKCL